LTGLDQRSKYSNRRAISVIELSRHHQRPEPDERPVIVLEFVAAAAVLGVIGVVLYMVFTYRPV